MDTIHALATAPGRAGIAVIRISGPLARDAAMGMAGSLPEKGRVLRTLRGTDGEVLDQALILVFPKGESFTGEEVVELHLHGSPAVIAAVGGVLDRLSGLRRAEPGEFTRRALENGRLDLAQVEGLADLLGAETEAQRRQAVRLMSGELGQVSAAWRTDLVRARALIEATIDFADEDVPTDVGPEVRVLVDRVLDGLERMAAGTPMAERIRSGFEVAIVGEPNSGKSTLLNRLAGREAAITSEHAGTTRDVIEVRMDLGGLPVTLLDTAGVRETAEVVEQMGIARAVERAAAADLRVHLLGADRRVMLRAEEDDILVAAKDDRGEFGGVSGLTGLGVDALVERISVRLSALSAYAGLASRERHRSAMLAAASHLRYVNDLIPVAAVRAEEVAEELRLAVRAIDSLIGRVDVEDVLDVVFASFCIGK